MDSSLCWSELAIKKLLKIYSTTPNTEWDKPGLIIHCPSGDGKEEGKLALRFLSALAWVYGDPIQDEGFWITGTHANPCYRDEREPDYSSFISRGLPIDEYDYLPFPEDEKAQIALALYREAVNIDNEAYKFLSFFKILNIEMDGKGQIAWINTKIDNVRDHQAKERILSLKVQHNNLGEHLYVSGRCAVAHANSNPVINPDNPEDRWRLKYELPIIKGLAELMIEQEFGIKSSTTVWREHLYELAGFKELLGTDLLDLITEGYDFNENGVSIPILIESCLPKFSVRLRAEKEKPFENLTAKVAKYEQGRFWLECSA